MQPATTLESVLKRDRLLVASGLVAVVVLAWAYIAYLSWDAGGPGMGMGPDAMAMEPWGAVDFALTFIMWSVMMVATMVPSAAPMVLLFATVNRKRRQEQRPFVPTGLFLAVYVAVWASFSALATTGQWALHSAALLSPAIATTSPILAGAILLLAGLFQWSPLKSLCLTRCRSPLSFLMSEWREGTRGSLVMGLRHGMYCLGCCWTLMALLFVAGVMNLVWVALIAALVLVEKVVPRGQWVGRAAGLLLLGLGAWTIGASLV